MTYVEPAPSQPGAAEAGEEAILGDLIAYVRERAAGAQARTADGGAEALASLDLPTLFGTMAAAEARILLFEAARAFGAIDLEAAFAPLLDAADALLEAANPLRGQAIGVPLWAARAGASRGNVVLFEPQRTDRPLACIDASMTMLRNLPPDAARDERPLLGFPSGRCVWFDVTACAALGGVQVAAADGWAWRAAQAALLLGLLTGGAQRMVVEAYAYARHRESSGQVIALHQAVALRLADIAIAGRALDLHAEAVVSLLGDDGDPALRFDHATAAHLHRLAFTVSRDALQVAAGHGYVAGLPFRDYFARLRTLGSMVEALAAISSLAPGAPH